MLARHGAQSVLQTVHMHKGQSGVGAAGTWRRRAPGPARPGSAAARPAPRAVRPLGLGTPVLGCAPWIPLGRGHRPTHHHPCAAGEQPGPANPVGVPCVAGPPPRRPRPRARPRQLRPPARSLAGRARRAGTRTRRRAGARSSRRRSRMRRRRRRRRAARRAAPAAPAAPAARHAARTAATRGGTPVMLSAAEVHLLSSQLGELQQDSLTWAWRLQIGSHAPSSRARVLFTSWSGPPRLCAWRCIAWQLKARDDITAPDLWSVHRCRMVNLSSHALSSNPL